MLRHLSIRDYVLVDSLEVPFHAGMTVLTGETGAGKSILVDALSLILGDRAESGVVRQGAGKAEIGAEFDVSDLPLVKGWLEESGLESEQGQCLVRRTVEAEGRSRAFINGSAVTLTQLRELGEQLVDIHGQHAHHALLKSSIQREVLDEYAGARAESLETAAAWRAWQAAGRRLQAAREEASARLLEKEGLESAIAEVTPLLEDLRTWDELQADHQRQAHMSGLIESSAQLLAGMEDEETGILHRLHQLRGLLHEMLDKDAGLADELALFDAALNSLEEARHGLNRHASRLNLDPERLADMDRRMAEVLRVSRKHRLLPAELLDRYATWEAKVAALDAEQDIDALESNVQMAEKAYRTWAGKLSSRRAQAAQALAEAVTQTMSELALGDGRFTVKLMPCEPQSHGMEEVAFLAASHASLALGPLDKVASGGELSRISLAIQTALSGEAGVPTVIYDEVDVGIGGGVAEVVGRRLAQLSSNRQVLVVTHLPQVAAFGHNHLRVSKLAGTDRVISQVEPLDQDGRLSEIARMLGGQEITETTLKHAREMLLSASTGKSGKGRKRSA
jgi:DNA repair protein RecN (Recombination protein N)